MADIDGYVAVPLWAAYQKEKDRRFLQTLLAYNVQDAINLEALMVHAYNANLRLAATAFAAGYSVPHPGAAHNPFTPHPDAVRRALRENNGFFPAGGPWWWSGSYE